MVGYVALDGGGVTIDAARLARSEVADGVRKAGVGDEMRRAHQGRHEAPRHLVLALSPRLEALQFPLDAVFDPLVVAGLEVQAVKIAAGTPVAAVQGIGADEEYGDGNRLLPHTRNFQ